MFPGFQFGVDPNAGTIEGLFGGVIGAVMGAAIGPFVSAGICHLMLMMLGGANYGYETTYRAVAYVAGTINLLLLLPCGPFIALVATITGIVYQIIAISRMQEISGGKASAAVLLPAVICCACGVGVFLVVMSAVGAAGGFAR
jgi:hypothetical protein